MGFYEILDQVVDLLRRRGRVTYRALQREFQLDEDALTDLKDEILYAHPEVHDDAGRGLVWSRAPDTASTVASPAASPPGRAPLAYTPAYLAEQILAARGTLEGERKQVTVLFADLKGSTELIADLDPEAAQRLLDPALQNRSGAKPAGVAWTGLRGVAWIDCRRSGKLQITSLAEGFWKEPPERVKAP
jgi:hypothetical protein